jgi:putative sterol carrier protein
MAFDPKLAKDVNMNVHFVFYGKENKMATIIIKDKTVSVKEGLEGTPDLKVRCDSEIWLKIVRKDISSLGTIKAVFSKKLQVQGGLRRLKQFQKCFVMT